MTQQKLVSKSNKNDKIKLSTIFIIGIVLVALVLSILAMIFANDNKITSSGGSDLTTETPTPYNDYVTQDDFDKLQGTLVSDYTRNEDFNRKCKDWAGNTDLKDFINVNSITFVNNNSINNGNEDEGGLEISVTEGSGLINFVGSTGKTTLALNDVNRDIIQIINASGNDNDGKYWYYNYSGEDGIYSPSDN